MDWHIQSINFLLAFPHSLVMSDIYLRPPKVPKIFKIPDLKHPSDVLMKLYMLLKNYMVLRILEALGLISLDMDSSIGYGKNQL